MAFPSSHQTYHSSDSFTFCILQIPPMKPLCIEFAHAVLLMGAGERWSKLDRCRRDLKKRGGGAIIRPHQSTRHTF